MEIVPFEIAHYAQAFVLWQNLPGVGLSSADEREAIQFYLKRNPGMSFVALEGNRIIATVLAGHDGRRGFIHHLAVDKDFQRKGIGRQLALKAVENIQTAGIQKIHIFLKSDNQVGRLFWQSLGWTFREDVIVVSLSLS